MTNALRNYQPFNYVKSMYDYGCDAWSTPKQNCMGLCEKIAKVSLAILLVLPALLLDLAMSAASLIYRACSGPATNDPKPAQLPPPVVVVQPLPPKEIPDSALVARVLTNPYPELIGRRIDSVKFFQDSLTAALSFHENNQRLYKEALRDSIDIEDEDFSIHSSIWAAGCFLAYCLRAYPRASAINFSENLIQELVTASLELSPVEQATSLLKIMAPNRNWQLSEAAVKFVQKIQGRALAMTRDAAFLQRVLAPVTRNIDNI